ncbi:MAG: Septum formation initiator, partial [Anaerocolumna sp.]|nr:Septum formation initiator [Anaerocolumna sp.]
MKNYQKNNIRKTYYVEGNTARNLQAVPDYQVEEVPLRREQPRRETRKRKKANISMDIFSFLFFAIAVTITLYTCIEYLGVQSNITRMEKKAATLESELVKLENQNRAALSEIDTSLDLNYIYKVATNELGMVYPKENQVITYESTLSDYVRQY